MDNQDASAKADRAVVNEACEQSSPKAFIPNAYLEDFCSQVKAKERKFSEVNPALWRDLLNTANPPSLTVCRHLESEDADAACPCGYAGSVWADGERVLFTMGDTGEPKDLRTERVERPVEIATAQLITALYNNAEWLISLAAQAIEARSDETRRGSAVGESAVTK